MNVVFIHGPAASGKHTIGERLSELTGLPLFHNHLAVDAAKSLFEFGTPAFKNLRAAVWLSAFSEAAKSGRSFIFTFHPEASVDPGLVEQLVDSVEGIGGRVLFVELVCSTEAILERLGNSSRAKFGKLTDVNFFRFLEQQGAFDFPSLPSVLSINTEKFSPDLAAEMIAKALDSFANAA